VINFIQKLRYSGKNRRLIVDGNDKVWVSFNNMSVWYLLDSDGDFIRYNYDMEPVWRAGDIEDPDFWNVLTGICVEEEVNRYGSTWRRN